MSGTETPTSNSGFRTAFFALAAAIVSALGTISVAYFTGVFQVANTQTVNQGSLDLERLKFSNELIKGALSAENSANSLLFYADVGLLQGLEVLQIKNYAEKEKERIQQGGDGNSLLPSFDKSSRPALWLDTAFANAFLPNAKPELLESLVSTGNFILTGFAINKTPERLSTFLGYISYETAGFSRSVENANFSSSALLRVFPRSFDAESAEDYAHQQERILNRVYAGRLGNGDESSGDGWKYRGRGFMWTTGRANYESLSTETGIDLVTNPNLLDNPHVSFLIAASLWYSANLNELADKGDLQGISRKIGGRLAPPDTFVSEKTRAEQLLNSRF